MDLRKTFCVKCKGDTNNVNSFVVQHVKARQILIGMKASFFNTQTLTI